MSKHKLSFEEAYNSNPDFRAVYNAQREQLKRDLKTNSDFNKRLSTPTEIISLGVKMQLKGNNVSIIN